MRIGHIVPWVLATAALASAPAWAAGAQDASSAAMARPAADDEASENMALIGTLETGHGADLAFWGDLAIIGLGGADGNETAEGFRNDGFAVADISAPRHPRLLSTFHCTGTGADVSVWRDLVVLSVDSTSAGTFFAGDDCDADLTASDPRTQFTGETDAFAGIRIVSIADPRSPRLVANVNFCRGVDPLVCQSSHTHSILPDEGHLDADGDPAPRLIVYSNNSDIVTVPLDDPAAAELVDRPTVDRGAATGRVGCHDTAVFAPRALGACIEPFGLGDVALWDLREPTRPTLISVVDNPDTDHPHSAAFSWDGNTMVVGDENQANYSAARCSAGTDEEAGRLWFYDVTDPSMPTLTASFQLPRQLVGGPESGYCSPHQFNVVPLTDGRDIVVSSWYLGGTTVIDFSDPSAPFEIAHYVAAPSDVERRSNPWASYWYRGNVWANNMSIDKFGVQVASERGLDVFALDTAWARDALELGSFSGGTQLCLPLEGVRPELGVDACASGRWDGPTIPNLG